MKGGASPHERAAALPLSLGLHVGVFQPRPPARSLKPPFSNTVLAFAPGCLFTLLVSPLPRCATGDKGLHSSFPSLFHTLQQLPVLPETLQAVKLVRPVAAGGVLPSQRDLWINLFRPVSASARQPDALCSGQAALGPLEKLPST